MGYENLVDIFGGNHKTGLVLGSFLCIVGSLLFIIGSFIEVNVQNGDTFLGC